jgi:hypothetical protein
MRSVPPPKPSGSVAAISARDRRLQLRWLLPALIALVGLLAYLFLRADPQDMGRAQSLLMQVVAVAIVLGFLLVLAVPLVYARIRHRALASTEGVFVEFHGQRMRTLEHDAALWLHAQDVHAVLGLSAQFQPKGFAPDEYALIDALIGGKTAAYSLAGVQKLTAGKTSRVATQLPRWFEFEVQKPWQRREAVRIEVPVKYMN